MMLHGHNLDTRKRLRIHGRAIGRMKIVSDYLRNEVEQAAEVPDRLTVRPEGGLARQVAKMLTEERFCAADKCERALELPPAGQDRPACCHRKLNGQRNIAA